MKEELTSEQFHALSDIDKAIEHCNQIKDGLLNTISGIKGVSVEESENGTSIDIIGMTNEARRISFKTQYESLITQLAVLKHIKRNSYSLDPGWNLLHVRTALSQIKEEWKEAGNLDYMIIPDVVHVLDLKKIGSFLVHSVTIEVGKGNINASVSIKSITDFTKNFVLAVKEGREVFLKVEEATT